MFMHWNLNTKFITYKQLQEICRTHMQKQQLVYTLILNLLEKDNKVILFIIATKIFRNKFYQGSERPSQRNYRKYKTLMKIFIEDKTKWKDMLCSRAELNVISKTSIFKIPQDCNDALQSKSTPSTRVKIQPINNNYS